ncbi:amino acid ABC transporter ATP-binding protein [Weissella cibaria]|uniref:amino acid ABC transporter ATP-binding protein n=1 Tax=Weissella cibaria TaxID=137591 RepID=UPI0013D9D631|nr:ATP-binding cassette domain-containing protein [Weissella cibaria]MCA1355776.1 amino acid ABC transporter ATP-binding protein [Weissella cibaria]MDQ2124883.1 ATP-binding cassette domain-containing protein [Weissella cibaria]MDQ2158412.1 ATP-binding cassette domain-containing protein [Weissella cibaria]NFA02916.1 amino acid ABC transporter ATP-binding protein [Weissella cibaria]
MTMAVKQLVVTVPTNKKHVTKEVLHEVSFDIPTAQVLTILGPSGAGKSTLIRTLNGLQPVTTGSVPDLAGQTAMVFQHFNLFANLTALDNVASPLYLTGQQAKAAARERAMTLLEKFNLAGVATQYPSSLSGGQKQRIGILRALITEAPVLLLDEPTSALDPESIREVTDMITEVAKLPNRTIILVTHDIAFARDISDDVLLLADGRVQAFERADDFFASEQQNTAITAFLTR